MLFIWNWRNLLGFLVLLTAFNSHIITGHESSIRKHTGEAPLRRRNENVHSLQKNINDQYNVIFSNKSFNTINVNITTVPNAIDVLSFNSDIYNSITPKDKLEEPETVVRLEENDSNFNSATTFDDENTLSELQEIFPTTEFYENEFESEASNTATDELEFVSHEPTVLQKDVTLPSLDLFKDSVTYVESVLDGDYVTKTVEDEYDLVLETLVSTVTLYNGENKQNIETSHRAQRSISEVQYNEYRGFGNDEISPSLPQVISFETHAPGLSKQGRRSDADPNRNIDNIIGSILHILGGNVKIDAASSENTRLTTFGGNVHSSRINNRGPPRLPAIPFGVIPPSPHYSELPAIPLRDPITPPGGRPNLIPPGRPSYVANTRPPFMAPLPPSLASRPVLDKPTRRPLPIGPLLNDDETDVTTSAITLAPSTATEDPSDSDTILSGSHSPDISQELSDIDRKQENENENNLEPSQVTIDLTDDDTTDFPKRLTNNLASVKVTPLSGESYESSAYDIATSLVAPGLPTAINLFSSVKTSTRSPTHATISNTLTTPISTIYETTSSSTTLSSESALPDLIVSSESTPPLPSTVDTPPPPPEPTTETTEIKATPPTSPKYVPRPGVVLDESQYRPGAVITGAVIPFENKPGDIFDVTVSAYQGFGAQPPASINYHNNVVQPQLVPGEDNDGYVSIDGRKTYFDLIPTKTEAYTTQNTNLNSPSPIPNPSTGFGFVIPEENLSLYNGASNIPSLSKPQSVYRPKPKPPKPQKPQRLGPLTNRPSPPPRIRIDTCIVGDDTTCNEQLGEICKTVEDVSSCYCSPGTYRMRHRTPCKKTVTLHMSMKVDRVGDRRIVWGGNYGNPESEEYKILRWEAKHAIDDALSKSPLSPLYMGSHVEKFYSLGGKVIVNSTITLEDTPSTRNSNIKMLLQRNMIQVIQSHRHNIGNSILGVEGLLNPIPQVGDINECNEPDRHNCHEHATCINVFGSFTCKCLPGYTDRHQNDPDKVGRDCETCSNNYCNKRGQCYIEKGQRLCSCKGSYYGATCEIDGEVLGVAVGASVAAVVIIILTLIFLCLWSRKWKAQDRKSAIMVRGMMGAQTPAYNMTMPPKGTLPYGAMEDRIRWASMAEAMANQNIYSQPGPMTDHNGYYTNNSSEYLTTHPAFPAFPFSMYNRVTRALSNSIAKRKGSKKGVVDRLRRFVGGSSSSSRNKTPSFILPEHAYGLGQMMSLQNRLNSVNQQPEQMRPQMMHDHTSQHSAYHTLASRDYTSLASLQHYPPSNHFTMSQINASRAPSTYGGISQAPTLGARTPQPLRDARGAATMGPLGGASVVASGYNHHGQESSEEDLERPYQLPRPKSRTSLGDTDDIYHEPADFDVPPRPTRGPPPLPNSFIPQTFNMASFMKQ